MPNDHEPLFAGVKTEAARLKSDIAALAQLRWQLARLEATAAARSLRRLAGVLMAAALAAVVTLPLVFVALADVLDGRLGVPRWGWLLAMGLGSLLTAALAAWTRWRRFRQEFVGFEQTIEELHEDVVWLRERFAKREEGI